MAFDEMKKTVVAAIETRLNNQIIGTFSISWCLFNWKAIATIIFPSSISLADRFTALEKLGYGGLNPSYDYLVWYPVFSTLFVLFVIPPFSLIPEIWENIIQYTRNLIKSRILKRGMIPFSVYEANTELLHEQIGKLKREARDNEQAFEERGRQVKERDAEDAKLKNDLVKLENQHKIFLETLSENDKAINALTIEKKTYEEILTRIRNELSKYQSESSTQKTLLTSAVEKLDEKRNKPIMTFEKLQQILASDPRQRTQDGL